MKSVLDSCAPRGSILQGTFNPEVFTAALGPVIQHYRGVPGNIDSIYTDAEEFFRVATYPTQGLQQTVSSVFRRLAGDAAAPSIYRLETAFGGGKTHCLIACVHIASRGTELAGVTQDILPAQYLPAPGSIVVAGIAGDEIPVSRTQGDRLIPYTLWGELAYQIGGEALYRQVKAQAESFAAPGKHFLDTVLGGRKVLIMLDELAQYAARLEVAVPDQGADQLAAFLMSLNGYAKQHTGVVLIVTLAGAADAFSRHTEHLTQLLNQIGAGDIHQDDAAALAEQAVRGVTSVVMRDATAVTPVQASEIASVLAKRLFDSVDPKAAQSAAEEYAALYRRNSAALPEEAANPRFHSRMAANYPFHPTLIDFLNNKLAQAEYFQGTRGVLRVLAMTVRSIWNRRVPVPLIHVSDIDLHNNAIVNELLGRTASADLRQVLNADVGSADSHSLRSGLSNAQRADQRNPHPDGLPLYEKTWKVVFLNSLVGRAEGRSSKIFGVSQQDAVFQTATPALTPSQVRTALDEIAESAFYLRYEDGTYYAHLDPTINSVLAMIRQTIDERRVKQKLCTVAQGLLRNVSAFRVEAGVRYPEDIPDHQERPTLAVIAPDAQEIDPMELILQRGGGRPREHQNLVILLAPKTVKVRDPRSNQQLELGADSARTTEIRERVETIARQVLAIDTLKENPQAYGIAPAKLNDPDFVSRDADRHMGLTTSVYELYTDLYYPAAGGLSHKELRAVADGDVALFNQVLQIMGDSGDLVPSGGRLGAAMLGQLRDNYFFKAGDKVPAAQLLSSFFCYRSWPMLPGKDTLEALLREGVDSGVWVAYQMSGDPADTLPSVFYSQQNPLPLGSSLLSGGYSLMTAAGARRRGWGESGQIPNERIKTVLSDVMHTSGTAAVGSLIDTVQFQLAGVPEQQIKDNIRELIQTPGYALYQGTPDQTERPDAILNGFAAFSYDPQPGDVLITLSEQSQRGWLDPQSRTFRLSGGDGARRLVPLLRRLASLYIRGGATSTIDSLDISDLRLPGGGTLRIALSNAAPGDIKLLDDLFQAVSDAAAATPDTDADLIITNPDDGCGLIRELNR